MNNHFLFVIILSFSCIYSFSQPFKFAFLSDAHIGVQNADEDLRRSVADINADTALKFVIISGDITELGTDEEMWLAKRMLSQLKKPLYVVTGNHDGNWSPSGGRIFKEVFGTGRFSFQYNGYLFIGTNAGPVMQHKAPGQVPREDIVWMDSLLNNLKDKNIPIVYVNHFPQDSSQRNWYEAMDRLKKKNIQLFLVGHGHVNHQYVFEGVPGIMGRTNMRNTDTTGAYNVVTFTNGKATFEERKPFMPVQNKWAEAILSDHHFSTDTIRYPRPSYATNASFPTIKLLWQHEEKFDIGAGVAITNNLIIATSNEGVVYALDEKDGRKKWAFKTKGKIYSTPAISENYVVAACTDSTIYCLNAATGKQIWKHQSLKPIVASPAIKDKVVFIGGSDGHFSAINIKTGKLKWDFNGIKDFVMTKPLIYNGKVYFGSWGSEFYALNASTGKLVWKWKDTSENRMFSPAGCRPVATKNTVFIVAPDQYMTAFEAATGKVVWRTKMPAVKVRESMGLAADSSLVFVKTTDGKLYGISTAAAGMQPVLKVDVQIGNDINAVPVIESNSILYVPSNSGVVSAVDRPLGKLIWKYKLSNSNVTSIVPIGENRLVVSTVDGKITCLQF